MIRGKVSDFLIYLFIYLPPIDGRSACLVVACQKHLQC